MKNIRNKILTVLCLLAIVGSMMSGCGANTSKDSSSTSSSISAENASYSNTTITAKVTAVNGNTITADIGELVEMSKPDGNAGDGNNASAPEKPENDNTNSQSSGSDSKMDAPPEKPENGSTNSQSSGSDSEMGTPPEGNGGGNMPSMKTFKATEGSVTFEIPDSITITKESIDGTQSASASDITVDSVIEVTFGNDNTPTSIVIKNVMSNMGGPGGGGFGGSATVTNGTSANTISENTEVSGTAYTSTGDDENALRIDNATVTLNSVTIQKTGGKTSNTENGDFYGQNAGLLALNGANVTIKNSTVNTTAQNGNGIFSYGEGTVVNIYDTKIRTTADNSGGIQTTGGGTTNAYNLDVETSGKSSAAIRSDRGGGTVNVDGGTYVSNGTGSPAIYSTANITVSNATLNATNSEAVVVEGKNSVTLNNCNVTGNMTGTYKDNSENIHNVMIYQSMSGDADVGHATFTMNGGSLTAKAGDMFYVTNTSCTISLSNVKLALANKNLLVVAGNNSSRGWGTSGKNGGQVTFTADSQTMEGIISVDKISTLTMTMQNGTSFTGAINPDGAAGEVNVTMDDSSTWTLTADSYITSFNGDVSKIVSNGYKVYVNGTAIN